MFDKQLAIFDIRTWIGLFLLKIAKNVSLCQRHVTSMCVEPLNEQVAVRHCNLRNLGWKIRWVVHSNQHLEVLCVDIVRDRTVSIGRVVP